MVLPLLLSQPTSVLRYGDLGRTVLQCLHTVHSMERSLSTFNNIVIRAGGDDTASIATLQQSLSSFDAHVGDCACQIRAQILWDLVILYTAPENKAILPDAIKSLQEIRSKTALLFEQIELGRGKPRSPTLAALASYPAIWEHIGFNSFAEHANRASRRATPTADAPQESPAAPTGQRKSRHRHRNLTVDAAWNPHDVVFVTRFLTMCNLLSEYKIAVVELGPPARVKIRVDLQPLYRKNVEELEALQLTVKKLDFHIKALERMTLQSETMQSYVSRVTTDWVRETALKDRERWSTFPEELTATSDRRLACAATYISFLLVRDAWIKYDIPIIAMVQHFCSHGGYRNLFYRIVKNQNANIVPGDYSAIGEADWFKTELLSLEQVAASPWSKSPHIMILCMSCAGTSDDFKQRFFVSQQNGLSAPFHCDEVDSVASAVNQTNISRLLAHFFAQHEQFPFRLCDVEDQYDLVGSALEEVLGKEARGAFDKARFGAEAFGTGRSAELTTIEHIFLEFPDVFARDIEEHGEVPRIFGCKLA